MRLRLFIIFLLTLPLSFSLPVTAQNSNEATAKRIFMKAYNMVFGPQGCFFHYDARLSFFFHSKGWSCMKAGKYAYDDTKTHGWCEGKTFYYLDRKKKEIQILNGHSAKNGSVMDKFTFRADNYHYQWTDSKEGYIITIKAKENVDGVKTAKVLIDKHTFYPKQLSVRIAFLWAKVDITRFRSGGINDVVFVFPRQQYKGYTYVDKRK